jgi:hypothetical protein
VRLLPSMSTGAASPGPPRALVRAATARRRQATRRRGETARFRARRSVARRAVTENTTQPRAVDSDVGQRFAEPLTQKPVALGPGRARDALAEARPTSAVRVLVALVFVCCWM